MKTKKSIPKPPVLLNKAAPAGKSSLYARLLPYIITAVISTTIGIIIYKAKHISPFGDQSVLCMDLWGQYFPMYVNNKNAGLSEMFHSWNGAFGFNNWAQNAYYCNSPFLLLMKLVPYRHMITALDIFCLAKIVLSSLTFLSAAQYKCKGRSPIFIGGAVCYAFSAYMIAFISQFMWTDALVMAPLVVIGLEKLIHEKKPLMYTIVLAYTVIVNFYIGFAVCIFSILYFLADSVTLISVEKTGKTKHLKGVSDFYGAIGRFSVYSLIAGAISAFMTVPMAMALSHTLATDDTAPKPEKLEWYGNITTVFQYALPENKCFQDYVGINIYCGILIFLAVPLFFANKAFKKTERITSGCVFGFLVLSMNCNYLNYMWHGFHFPNHFPGRWSFLFTLYALMLSCRGLYNHRGLTIARAAIGTAIGSLGLILTSKGMGSASGYKAAPYALAVFIIAAIAVIFNSYSSAALEHKDNPRAVKLSKRITECFTVLIALLMVFDIGHNSYVVSRYEGSDGIKTTGERDYSANVVNFNESYKYAYSGDDDFYRTAVNNRFTFNSPMIGNYKGIDYYSSTMNGNVYNFLKFLGNHVYGDKVSSVYNFSSPVQNSLFGIKNYIDRNGGLTDKVSCIVKDDEATSKTGRAVYTNTTALPLAYAISEDALDYEVTDQLMALKNQNDLVSALCGEDVKPYVKVEPDKVDLLTVTLKPNDNLNYNFYSKNEGEEEAAVDFTYTAPKDGFYLFEHNFRAGDFTVLTNNKNTKYKTTDNYFNAVGNLKKGDQVKIQFRAEGVNLGCYGLELYYLDEDVWNKTYHKLLEGGLDVTKCTGTNVKGTIDLDKESMVMATIEQDGGWSVYCDGEKLGTEKFAGALTCFKVPAGKHDIEFRYHVPGLLPGCLLTLAGIGALIAMMFYEKKRRGLSAAETAESDASDDDTQTAVKPVEETSESAPADNVKSKSSSAYTKSRKKYKKKHK